MHMDIWVVIQPINGDKRFYDSRAADTNTQNATIVSYHAIHVLVS